MARRSMTTKVVVALAAALALALPAAATNEGPQTGVYLKFSVTGCGGGSLVGAKVVVSGCVDSTTTLTTDSFGNALLVIDQCFGSSRNLCSYSVFDPLGRVSSFTLSATTLLDSNGSPISPNKFSGCLCDGTDTCTQYYPATVTASPANGVCAPLCPTTCSFTEFGKGGKAFTVNGDCSSALNPSAPGVCPEGFLDSGFPCEAGQDCGKCCIKATSLCGEPNGKPCAGASCTCFERSKPGAACAASGAANGGGCEERGCNAFFARTAGTGGACCPEPGCENGRD